MANPATPLAWSSVTSTPGSVLAGWSGGGGGGGAWPGTGVKPAGDLGLLYLVRHLGGPEPLHDEAGGNDATESVHTYGGMGNIIVPRKSAAWGGRLADVSAPGFGWG